MANGWHVSVIIHGSDQEIVIYAGRSEEETRQFFHDCTADDGKYTNGAMNEHTDIYQVLLLNGKNLESYAFN